MKFLSSLLQFLSLAPSGGVTKKKNIILDTDLFSDVDDTAALLLAATSPDVNLLAVNINYPSSYSAVAASAILAHYGRSDVPISIKRPLTDETFFDSRNYKLGEYVSKIAYQWSGGSLPWGHAEDAWDPVKLYRKTLAQADDGSVTIVSIGFLDNLSALLNSTSDSYSALTGRQLIKAKVSELVVMGGGYPSGHSWNFWGSDPALAAHAINTWEGRIMFTGDDVGRDVKTGGSMIFQGPEDDPVRQAYIYYNFYKSHSSWDPLAVLYAIEGLGNLFVIGSDSGYNYIEPNGTNRWISDESRSDQSFLRLRMRDVDAASDLDRRLLEAVTSKAKKDGRANNGEL